MATKTARMFCVAMTVAGLAAGTAACSSEASVSKDDVAKQVSDQLAGQVGHKPDSVTCPTDLKATVGTTEQCSLTDAGATYGVAVTVTSVDGSNVKFDIKVDDKPK